MLWTILRQPLRIADLEAVLKFQPLRSIGLLLGMAVLTNTLLGVLLGNPLTPWGIVGRGSLLLMAGVAFSWHHDWASLKEGSFFIKTLRSKIAFKLSRRQP